MSNSIIDFDVLESKIVSLLNKLKDNHLLINQLKSQNTSLKEKVEKFEKDFNQVKVENESLKMTNSLLGGNEDKSLSKRKINNLIKEVVNFSSSIADKYLISDVTFPLTTFL